MNIADMYHMFFQLGRFYEQLEQIKRSTESDRSARIDKMKTDLNNILQVMIEGAIGRDDTQ